MDLTNSDTRVGVKANFRDPLPNVTCHDQFTHQRKALEPLSEFGGRLTVPGVARTIIANPWLRAVKPISFRDRGKVSSPEFKN